MKRILKKGLSHLDYKLNTGAPPMGIVKMHRVLLSNQEDSASARRVQIHRAYLGDRGALVVPFMQVCNYQTRNFATFESSELGLSLGKS